MTDPTAIREADIVARLTAWPWGPAEGHGASAIMLEAAAHISAQRRELEEEREENARWLFRISDIREASGLGAKPMLGELPGEIAKIVSRSARAEALLGRALEGLREIARMGAGTFGDRPSDVARALLEEIEEGISSCTESADAPRLTPAAGDGSRKTTEAGAFNRALKLARHGLVMADGGYGLNFSNEPPAAAVVTAAIEAGLEAIDRLCESGAADLPLVACRSCGWVGQRLLHRSDCPRCHGKQVELQGSLNTNAAPPFLPPDAPK